MNGFLTTGVIYITAGYVFNYAMNKATEKVIDKTLKISKKVANAAIDHIIKKEEENRDFLDYILIEIDQTDKSLKIINVIEICTNDQNGYTDYSDQIN